MATYAAATTNHPSSGEQPSSDRRGRRPLSRWVQSRGKRCFDVALAIAALPIVAPVCLAICFAILATSRGPIFFRQMRIGKQGRPFSIIKFRTMHHRTGNGRGTITTIDDRHVTRIGRILRAWKLDELPQILHVLRGEMSFVGPRPRVPEQPVGRIDCLPGITGAASLVFAKEEILLAGIPRRDLDTYYAQRVIPLKQQLDDAYMARATFLTDLKIIALSAARVWMDADALLPAGLTRDAYADSLALLPGEACD
jgi:lipopolysaccharide/colanic/teichoic acid biosynthesis glycosyltransferase